MRIFRRKSASELVRTSTDVEQEVKAWNEHAISILIERGELTEQTAAELRVQLHRLAKAGGSFR